MDNTPVVFQRITSRPSRLKLPTLSAPETNLHVGRPAAHREEPVDTHGIDY